MIEVERKRLDEASNGGHARKQEEYEQAVSGATTARQKYNAHREGERGLRVELQRAGKKAEQAKEACDAKEKDHSEADERLRNLRKETGQRRTGFHSRLPNLKRAIDQEKSWTTPPIGPVGDHITLLKAKWSSILENAFGTTLNSFIVATKRDQTKLSDIMRQVDW